MRERERDRDSERGGGGGGDSDKKRGNAGRGSERGGGRIGLGSKDAVDSGLFSSGPAKIVESIFTDYTYKNGTKAPVWLVTFARKGEDNYEQAYSLGQGWKIKNGDLVALAGQTGLPRNCNAMRHLVTPLEKIAEATKDAALQEALDSGDPSFLEGAEVVVKRVPQEKRDIQRKGGKKQESDDKERTILEIEEVTEAPWEGAGGGAKGGGTRKAKATADRDDEDEKPTRGRGRASKDADTDADADDEDEDEKPAKGKATTKGKGKAAAADADDDDDTALLEEGTEALIAALEEEKSGSLDEADLEDALAGQLKKHPKADAIIELMLDHLDDEKGWSYNSKKKVVSLD